MGKSIYRGCRSLGVYMVYDLVVIYLGIWVVVAAGLYTVTAHFSDFRSPASHPLGISVLAGALWPLLLLGMAEFSSLAVLAKAREKANPKPASSSNAHSDTKTADPFGPAVFP